MASTRPDFFPVSSLPLVARALSSRQQACGKWKRIFLKTENFNLKTYSK